MIKPRKPIQDLPPDPTLEPIPAGIRLGGAPHFIRNFLQDRHELGKWLVLGRDAELPEGQTVQVYQRKDNEYVDIEIVDHVAERIVKHSPSSHSRELYGPSSRWVLATFQAHGDGSR